MQILRSFLPLLGILSETARHADCCNRRHGPDQITTNRIKSVLRFEPVFTAQMLTYLRITGLRVGLLLNFNKLVLRDGIRRIVL